MPFGMGRWRKRSVLSLPPRYMELNDAERRVLDVKMAVAKQLYAHRLGTGITQDQLAQLMGTTQARVSAMETVDGTASLDFYIRAMDALEFSDEEITRALDVRRCGWVKMARLKAIGPVRANLVSLGLERNERIHPCGAPRREPAGEQRYGAKHQRNAGKNHGVTRADAEHHAADGSAGSKRTEDTHHNADRGETSAGAEHEANDFFRFGTDGQADTNFAGALGDGEGDDAEQPDGGEGERE